MFKILCTVSGGVTGTRQAFYKEAGVEVTFEAREVAEAEAERLRRSTLSHPRATFSYTVVPVEP